MDINDYTPTALQGLGFESLVDFVLYNDSGAWGINWLSSDPMPTDEETGTRLSKTG